VEIDSVKLASADLKAEMEQQRVMNMKEWE
jgi:hypothetical protein